MTGSGRRPPARLASLLMKATRASVLAGVRGVGGAGDGAPSAATTSPDAVVASSSVARGSPGPVGDRGAAGTGDGAALAAATSPSTAARDGAVSPAATSSDAAVAPDGTCLEECR